MRILLLLLCNLTLHAHTYKYGNHNRQNIDVYKKNDTIKEYYVFIPGGGFLNHSRSLTIEEKNIKTFCFSKNINYVKIDYPTVKDYNLDSILINVYKAIIFIKDSLNADSIYLSGYSAGATTALFCTFYDTLGIINKTFASHPQISLDISKWKALFNLTDYQYFILANKNVTYNYVSKQNNNDSVINYTYYYDTLETTKITLYNANKTDYLHSYKHTDYLANKTKCLYIRDPKKQNLKRIKEFILQ